MARVVVALIPVLFDTPDRLLTLLQISPQQMLQGYRQVLDQPVHPRPFWQLEHGQRPGIEPLSGALVRVMLGECLNSWMLIRS